MSLRIYDDPDWPKYRFAAKWRARGRCEMCGAKGRDTHHVVYAGGTEPGPDDLRYLCGVCHAVFTWLVQKGGLEQIRAYLAGVRPEFERLGVQLADVAAFFEGWNCRTWDRLEELGHEIDLVEQMAAEDGYDHLRRIGRAA